MLNQKSRLLIASLGALGLVVAALVTGTGNAQMSTSRTAGASHTHSAHAGVPSMAEESHQGGRGEEPSFSPASATSWAFASVIRNVDPSINWKVDFPEEITIATDRVHPSTYRLTRTVVGADYMTWVMENGESTLIATDANGGVDMVEQVAGGAERFVSVRGLQVEVTELVQWNTCGLTAGDSLSSATAANELETAIAEGDQPSTDGIYYSDVLFFYDDATLAEANKGVDGDGLRKILSTVRIHIESINLALERSNVRNFRWRMITALHIPTYTRTGKMMDDLTQLENGPYTTNRTEAQIFAYDKAVEYGADHSVLYVHTPVDYAGLAWVQGHAAVVAFGTASSTLGHELGHNMGLLHDRKQQGCPDTQLDAVNYGHRFTHTDGRDVGDIMSYSGYRYSRYSNPEITESMANLFVSVYGMAPGDVTLGVAKGLVGSSDCRTALESNAASISGYRSTTLVNPPVIVSAPVGSDTRVGQTVTLSVQATGSHISYQWRRNGEEISFATGSTLTLDISSPAPGGTYDCVIRNGMGSVTTAGAVVKVNPLRTVFYSNPKGRITNLSTRGFVGGGDEIMIGGLAIADGPAKILVRAVGPTLIPFGVPTALADPTLKAFTSTGALFASNDNWASIDDPASVAAITKKVGGFSLPIGSADAALVLTVDAGSYTFHVSGSGGATGIALLEIYIVDEPGYAGKITNISTRGKVGTGDNAMIAGFVTSESVPVLVRGVGPSLARFGVPGALSLPTIGVYKGGETVDSVLEWYATYYDWSINPAFKSVGAFGFAERSPDSATILTVDGSYTAIVRGQNDGTGVALAEVYLLPTLQP
jgi:hypothetical protein